MTAALQDELLEAARRKRAAGDFVRELYPWAAEVLYALSDALSRAARCDNLPLFEHLSYIDIAANYADIGQPLSHDRAWRISLYGAALLYITPSGNCIEQCEYTGMLAETAFGHEVLRRDEYRIDALKQKEQSAAQFHHALSTWLT